MSEFRNCINCGAPLETEVDKCPYCGTSYFDIGAFQLTGEPVILKIRVPEYIGYKDGAPGYSIVTALVRPSTSVSISMCSDKDPVIDMSFTVVQNKMRMEKEE